MLACLRAAGGSASSSALTCPRLRSRGNTFILLVVHQRADERRPLTLYYGAHLWLHVNHDRRGRRLARGERPPDGCAARRRGPCGACSPIPAPPSVLTRR